MSLDYKIGQMVTNQGIYIGEWCPDIDLGLGKVFNAFAAAKDLDGYAPYIETTQKVGEIKNLHGHDGLYITYHGDFYRAIRNGSYKGQWILPLDDMIAPNRAIHPHGRTMMKTLYDLRNKGALKGTFNTVLYSGDPNKEPQPSREELIKRIEKSDYWTCSTLNNSKRIGSVAFSYGSLNWEQKMDGIDTWMKHCDGEKIKQSARVIRVVPKI